MGQISDLSVHSASSLTYLLCTGKRVEFSEWAL